MSSDVTSNTSTTSGKDPDKKHRHDIGAVDHGAHSTERVTRAIQVVLGTTVLASCGLVIYAITLIAR